MLYVCISDVYMFTTFNLAVELTIVKCETFIHMSVHLPQTVEKAKRDKRKKCE